jgi:hypothetical protein
LEPGEEGSPEPEDVTVKRRTLDIMFSIGGVAFAALLLVFGFVMQGQADFATTYVHDQLAEQKIFFTPSANLSEEEAQSACLVEYGTPSDQAARQMLTGKQAECYANDYIGLHLAAATGGMSYAELGGPQRELRTKVADAEAANDPALADLQAQLAAVDGQRDTAFRGETLRGLLLTTYGFSILGDKAALAATVAFIGGAVLALLSIAGFIHAFTTPKSAPFAPVDKEAAKV